MPLGNMIMGDDWTFACVVNDGSGGVTDIAGGSVWVTFKVDPLVDTDASALFQVANIGIDDVDDPANDTANGLVTLRAAYDSPGSSPPSNTMVTPGTYAYDFQYKDASGAITTIDMGTVVVVGHVTWAT